MGSGYDSGLAMVSLEMEVGVQMSLGMWVRVGLGVTVREWQWNGRVGSGCNSGLVVAIC